MFVKAFKTYRYLPLCTPSPNCSGGADFVSLFTAEGFLALPFFFLVPEVVFSGFDAPKLGNDERKSVKENSDTSSTI